MRIKAYNSIGNMIFFGFMAFTGALFPLSVLPTPIRYFCMIIPFTYLNDVTRHAALGTQTVLPQTVEYAVAIVAAVSIMIFGFVTFNRIERDARMRGSIASN